MKDLLEDPTFIEHSPWLHMPEFDWSCITKDLTATAYKRGQVIYHQSHMGDCVYLSRKGRVQLDIYSVNGDKRILFVAEPGALFGELAPFDGMPHICNATAITDCQIYAIPSQRFMQQLLQDHNFSLHVLTLMTKKLRLLSTLIKQLSFNNSTYRVAHALASLAKQHADQMADGTLKLTLKYTHQDLADLTGLSRVSVSNILLDMTSQGILEKDKGDGFTIIRDLNALQKAMDEYK